MSGSQKMRIIELLEPHGKVFITNENETESEFRKWQLRIAPERIHHLMFFATLFVGDSQTMTSEAAIMGTPALKCNTFAHKLSIPNMLEEKYDLCYSFQPDEFEDMLGKINFLLSVPELKNEWTRKREIFLKDTINPVIFLNWFVEDYPNSLDIIKRNPEFQYQFK